MKLIISQKFWSIKDRFTVYDENDVARYQVEAKFFEVPKTFRIYDMEGKELYVLKAKFISIAQKWTILQGENEIGHFKGKVIHPPLFRRFTLEGDFGKFRLKGSTIAWKWTIEDLNNDKAVVANFSKKIFKISDTYALELQEDKINPAIVLMLGLIVDFMFHKEH